jgi:hypothetical protein
MLSLTSCTVLSREADTGGQSVKVSLNANQEYGPYDGPPGTWAIYWYLCGSNLESGGNRPSSGGAATWDLEEMMAVELPDNVQVVIETGGALRWKNDYVDPDTLGRYLYAGSELELTETQPSANMGDPETFADFLNYCNKNYPAEKQVVVIWDHGGGSLMGAESDELFGGDLLSLPEMRSVFEAMPAASGAYEIVGFDACLMATVDVADMLDEYANYLVASEETEPGIGWNYTGLFKALAADTSQDGAQLGKAICDSFYETCNYYGIAEDVTLSVTDLSRFGALLDAYNAVGDEALVKAYKEKLPFYSAFEGAAYASENYGIVSGKVSNYDMVDLGDLMRNAEGILDGGGAVLNALKDCIVYSVKGVLNGNATGLACYFIYSGSTESLEIFSQLGTSRGFRYLYEYPLKGDLSGEGIDYINALTAGPVEAEPFPDEGAEKLDRYPIAAGTTDGFVMEISSDLLLNTADITSERFYVLAESTDGFSYDYAKGVIRLGYEFNYYIDEVGKDRYRFTDGFKGYWVSIDGALVTAWVSDAGIDEKTQTGYRTLLIPVLLNGEEYVIQAYQTFDTSGLGDNEFVDEDDIQFEIYGAFPVPDEKTGLPSKELIQLEPGDVIEPLFSTCMFPDGMDFEEVAYLIPDEWEMQPFGSVTVKRNTNVRFEYLGDGLYFSRFHMIDLAGKPHRSQSGWYVIEDHEWYSAGPIG